ncbi:MAG: DUF2256 and DUF3253 domain-containing protein [Proteobacteria bacterium]|nr:MAG: DUF2256 and DUF3253 domain-containing protein [Pseudomonadota bacterium]
MAKVPEPKNCEVCGRTISWRKKWEKNWDEVKFCGERCRRNKASAKLGHEEKILNLLSARAAGLTICPSEVLDGPDKQDKEKMEEVRQAARRLVHAGAIDIVQGGKVVDPSSFRGPIRLRSRR